MPALALVGLLLLPGCARDEEPRSGDVAVFENGERLGELPRRQAVEDVSIRVGFPVLLATHLPEGDLRLLAIEARRTNPVEAIGEDGRSNHVAIVTYVAGEPGTPESTAVRILEHSREVEPHPEAEAGDAGDDDTIWVAEIGPGGRSFAWNADDRGFIVEVGEPAGDPSITTEDVVEMLRSLR